MWLSGGGYIGTKGNSVVRKMDAFVDMWFSRDGLEWHKVSYDEGSGSNRYSSMNWAEVMDNKNMNNYYLTLTLTLLLWK